MILCTNCLHKEIVGAMFCSECGAQLVFPKGQTTTGMPGSADLRNREIEFKEPPARTIYPDAFMSLNIISTGDVIPIAGKDEVTLGRVSEGQPVIPDIDLTPYKAFESGVSRMHASIRLVNEQVMITDLGSANGTRINGKQISSHMPQPLKHGDILTLGKFKIQILLHSR
jgi:pSer/pThr/pTyr-binding forkhead associated (FHA) protein